MRMSSMWKWALILCCCLATGIARAEDDGEELLHFMRTPASAKAAQPFIDDVVARWNKSTFCIPDENTRLRRSQAVSGVQPRRTVSSTPLSDHPGIARCFPVPERYKMKITDLKIHVLKSQLAEPFAFSQGWVTQRSATIVEVHTDGGIIGWGEAFAQGMEPPEIAATTIDKALRPLVTGANPLDTEVRYGTSPASTSTCRSINCSVGRFAPRSRRTRPGFIAFTGRAKQNVWVRRPYAILTLVLRT
jgi:hypothetical protein